MPPVFELALLAIIVLMSIAGLVLAPANCLYLLGVVGLPVVVLVVVVSVRDRRKERARLRQLSTSELEKRVWRYEPEYFNWLGADEPCIVEFKSLIDRRDLPLLATRWRILDREFSRLEHRAGHRGRPVIMDYYYDQEEALAELVRRSPHIMPPNKPQEAASRDQRNRES